MNLLQSSQINYQCPSGSPLYIAIVHSFDCYNKAKRAMDVDKMIVIAQSFINCLTKWAWPKHMRGNAPNHTAWNFNKKLGKTSLMFSTSITFASLTESNWKIRLFPKVLLNWMENFTTIIISFSEEQFFYRKCIESFSLLKWVRSSDPEMIYRSQSSTWFMLGSEEGNKSWFFQLALTHTSWGYVL